jgi:uroporphyrinogen decarboxylase
LLFCTTIFNAWMTLRLLTQPPAERLGPPKLVDFDERDDRITSLLKQDRAAVAAALGTIGESLANFARLCLQAGANGVFLSGRDEWADRRENGDGTYDEMVRPTDLAILNAAAGGTFNVLHICGRAVNFEAFARYPVHALNWADRSAGPSIAYARDRVKPTLMGGVDNLRELPNGKPADVVAQVRDAVRQAKHRPILITPGCTFDPAAVPEANLRAMVDAAKEARY